MACVEVDIVIEDHLDEVDTKVLIKELERRSSKGDRSVDLGPEWRDWQRLADYIVEGEMTLALDELYRLSPVVLNRPIPHRRAA